MTARARTVPHPVRWAACGIVAVCLGILALGSLGLYVGTYKTSLSSTFVQHDGTAIVDESEEIFCDYLGLRGVATRSLAGRGMMAPQHCPWFDPGPPPLPIDSAADFTPISSYLRITQPPHH